MNGYWLTKKGKSKKIVGKKTQKNAEPNKASVILNLDEV